MLRVFTKGPRDACFTVESVSRTADGARQIDLGDVTFVQAMKDSKDYGKGYVYDFEVGDEWEILTVARVTTESGWPSLVSNVACEWK
jgi:hypothetical protein